MGRTERLFGAKKAMISAAMTPLVLSSFSSQRAGRSISFVHDRSRTPLALWPRGAVVLTASIFPVLRWAIILTTRQIQSNVVSPEYLSGRFTLALESTLCIHAVYLNEIQ